MNDDTVLEQVLARPPEERAAYLQAACTDNSGQHQRIAALLDGHARAGTIFAAPIASRDPAAVLTPSEQPGDFIGLPADGSAKAGRYRLVERLGEGGCGVV